MTGRVALIKSVTKSVVTPTVVALDVPRVVFVLKKAIPKIVLLLENSKISPIWLQDQNKALSLGQEDFTYHLALKTFAVLLFLQIVTMSKGV